MQTFQERNKVGTIETTATAIPNQYGTYTVHVIHRFDSGNFLKEKPMENQSLVSALGLLRYYTS